MLEGARWIRDNRDPYGLLHSGWSAEHLGDKDKPHYWDDLWGLAGLYEAARLAERIGAGEVAGAVGRVRFAQGGHGSLHPLGPRPSNATRGSGRRSCRAARRRSAGSTPRSIGAAAYFHPIRLYYGAKLGDDIDLAFRLTLDTIWSHFVDRRLPA